MTSLATWGDPVADADQVHARLVLRHLKISELGRQQRLVEEVTGTSRHPRLVLFPADRQENDLGLLPAANQFVR